jgi:homospermidine synthase
MNDEIVSGADELGVLLMGHTFKSWWTGSQMTIGEARTLVPGQSATTLQVAASILGAVAWMISHPDEGVCVPDDLPWREVMDVAYPYLGTCWTGPIDWDPLSSRVDYYDRWNGRHWDEDDPWQFANFAL